MIHQLEDNDVLFGRGNGIAFFPGNVNFRRIAGKYRDVYANIVKQERKALAFNVMRELTELDPPSRFLEPTDNGYQEVPEDRVIEKICQTLREKKFQVPKPQDDQRISKSLYNVPTPKKATKATNRKKTSTKKAKVTKNRDKKTGIERILKARREKLSPSLVDKYGEEAPFSPRRDSFSLQAPVVTPNLRIPSDIAMIGQANESGVLTTSYIKEDTNHHTLDGYIKPRALFTKENHYEDQEDVFGRNSSFLPKLELAHPGENAGLLARALEEELFEPFSTDDFYHYVDPRVIDDECNEPISFEVPPSLTAFFSDFSKRTPSVSANRNGYDDSPTTVLDMKYSFHAIPERDQEEEIMDWNENGNLF